MGNEGIPRRGSPNAPPQATHQDGAVNFVPVCLHLGVGDGVIVQHGLQVGPVGGEVRVEDALHCLQGQGGGGLF